MESSALVTAIDQAAIRLRGIALRSPLERSSRLSNRYGAEVLIKREDQQAVRSFKIRGAYNKVASLGQSAREHGVVCASAGNHGQGVASACALKRIRATIFMPTVTPDQKVARVRHFGGASVDVRLVGDTYDDAGQAAVAFAAETGALPVPPFDDPMTIAGQGTIGKEIVEDLDGGPDVLVAAVGGGGLLAGIAAYVKQAFPSAKLVGAEPAGAASMTAALAAGGPVKLADIDRFVDGAAVQEVGTATFGIFQRCVDRVVVVPEGKVCTTAVELYQDDGIIAEPAGALPIAALDELAPTIEGRRVVCVLSGGNNDILRYPEILERSLVYEGRKHYFIIEFAQKPGQLRRFVDRALGPTDDIVRFEYLKKNQKERGAALVGLELRDREDLPPLLRRMEDVGINYRQLSSHELLYDYVI
ncbi:MAG: threonine ammonia-lyase IlvA [Candidatus Dormibacteraeota bacterium]|nr:threonine ammonia-lyase IlvA [Candidatus Dormibacteraeota bacterium]